MKYGSAENVKADGELLRRMEANMTRLEGKEYTVEYVHSKEEDGWPGDYCGRTLLAMTQMSEMLGRPCKGMRELAEDILLQLSEKGYLGKKLGEGCVNEQQMAGNSWLLRSLLKHGDYSGDERFSSAARRLFLEYYQKVSRFFPSYPVLSSSPDVGSPIGTTMRDAYDGWQISSDVGCAFIALDGISDYYAYSGDRQAEEVFYLLFDVFRRIDPAAMKLQTHATLTALRGCMRMYAMNCDDALLKISEDRFQLYLSTALTVNYANYNWFGRPLWTEPCAITDSYILAMELFRNHCGDEYAETANRILYNGLLASQRSNGGFGCDYCVLPDGTEPLLRAYPDCYEAFWCCTMHSAEGLMAAARNNVYPDDGGIVVAGWNPGEYQLGDLRVCISGDYPWGKDILIELSGSAIPEKLLLYRPAYTRIQVTAGKQAFSIDEGVFAEITAAGEREIRIRFDMSEHIPDAGAAKVRWRGPLILAGEEKLPLLNRFYMPKKAILEGIRIID